MSLSMSTSNSPPPDTRGWRRMLWARRCSFVDDSGKGLRVSVCLWASPALRAALSLRAPSSPRSRQFLRRGIDPAGVDR